MTIEPIKYVRKPFEVEAIQVTEENIEAVKEWCNGFLDTDITFRLFIKVKVARALNERQTKAYPGDWVLYAGTGFKVYTDKAFHRTFEQLDGVNKDRAAQDAKSQIAEELRTVNETTAESFQQK